MKKPIVNPLHISVQPLAGRQLPADFSKAPMPTSTLYDQRDLSQLWKAPQWTSKFSAESVGNIVRSSRLSTAASGV